MGKNKDRTIYFEDFDSTIDVDFLKNKIRAISTEARENAARMNRAKQGLTDAIEESRVNHPSHYTWLKELCGIEVIDITRHMDFDLGNAIKYILRQGRKGEEGMSSSAKAIEDLEKAVFYINDKIKMLKDGIK